MERIIERIESVLIHRQFVNGPEVAQFEKEMADYIGVRHAIGCNSGTDALILALKSAGICSGQFVAVPSFTFQATANAVKWVGANPIFVDISTDDYGMDLDVLESTLSGGLIDAIITVDMFGIPSKMEAIREIVARVSPKTVIIEDAAQSMGSRLNGRKAGGLGDIGCTSFHPSKPLSGIGDGGMIFTNDDERARRIRSYKDHGRLHMTGFSKYWALNPGMNSRLDSIQAAALLERLAHFEHEIEYRQKQVKSYKRFFRDRPTCKIIGDVAGRYVNYSWFPVLFDDSVMRSRALKKWGEYGARIIYPWPLNRMGAFVQSEFTPCAVADSVCGRVLAFPIVHSWESNLCLCTIMSAECVSTVGK